MSRRGPARRNARSRGVHASGLPIRAVWVATGAAWIATGVAYRFGPSYFAAETLLDQLSTALFSTSLALMAAALWAVVAAARPGRWTAILGRVAGAGAALAGIANLVEDGLGFRWFAYPFFAGMLLLGAASVGFAIGLAATRPGFLVAAIAALLAVAPFAMGDAGPGKLLAGALWLALGLRGQREWPGHQVAPTITLVGVPPTDATTDLERFDRDVRSAIAASLIGRGTIPTIAEAAALLGTDSEATAAAFARMEAAHTFIPRPGSHEIYAYNPFCGEPTDFVVRAAGREWSAICGWDALGIAPALGTTGTVRTPCGDRCGETITIEVGLGGHATGEAVFHNGVPARHGWDDIYFT